MIMGKNISKHLIVFLIAFIFLSHSFLNRLPNGKLKIHFLDIGQGDSILIQTPYLQNILIDGGPDQKVLEELSQTMSYVIDDIDLLILSHPHLDHIGGLVDVLKRYQVKKILVSAVNYKNVFYEEFLKEINNQNIDIEIAESKKDFIIAPNLFLDLIYPIHNIAGKNFENVNNASIVFKLIYKNNRILFVGDCELECEDKILSANFDLSADILKVGHHGSRTSSSLDFLNAVKPKIAIIQSGKDNQFGHPHEETLEKFKKLGIDLKRNDLDGRINLEF